MLSSSLQVFKLFSLGKILLSKKKNVPFVMAKELFIELA